MMYRNSLLRIVPTSLLYTKMDKPVKVIISYLPGNICTGHHCGPPGDRL
jgi:hypothetical protein